MICKISDATPIAFKIVLGGVKMKNFFRNEEIKMFAIRKNVFSLLFFFG
jgi:hypothetical protein